MKEMLKRAFRTFIQAAAGFIASNTVYTLSSSAENEISHTIIIGLAASAIAAGLAAVMNMPGGDFKEPYLSAKYSIEEEENEA